MNTKSLILGILVVIIFSGVGFFVIQKSSPLESSESEGIKMWKSSQVSLAASISYSIIDPVLDNDPFAVSMNISQIKDKIAGLSYLIVVNKNNKILFHPDSSQIMQDYNPKELQPLGEKESITQSIMKGDVEVFDIATPVSLEGIKQGELHLGIINPWKDMKGEKPSSSLPKTLIIVAAALGLILTIIGAVGTAKPIKTVTATISKTEIEKLEKKKQELTTSMSKLNKEISDSKEKKTQLTGNETAMSKRVAEMRDKETKLSESIDAKKAELIKLEQNQEAMAVSSTESSDLKNQLASKSKKIEELTDQIANMKTKLDAKPQEQTQVSTDDIEEIKKEELELTQRIVRKRREEIMLSQKVESKRKEELALERKIEALTKKLKEMG